MVSLNSFEHLSPPPVSSQEGEQPLSVGVNDQEDGVLSEPGDLSNGLQEGSINWTSQEMCERIRSLITENVELREKLEKSHSVMKEQVEMISAWNEQISESDKKHKSLIEECLKKNQRLEEENDELKKKIDTNDQISSFSQSCLNDDSSLTTIVADDESDYAIIVQEDFLSLNSCTNAELKKVLGHCEKLQGKISSISAKLVEEKLKAENFETILGQKEEELQNLRQEQDDLTVQSTQSLSLVTCRDEENKVLSEALKETQDKMTGILEDLQRKQTKLNDNEIALNNKEVEFKTLKEKYNEMIIQNTESMSILSTYDEEKNNLLSAMQQLKSKADEMISEIQMKQKEFETCINDKETELKKLERQYMEQVEEIQSLHNKCDGLLMENKTMMLNAEELEVKNCQLAQEIQTLQLNLSDATKECEKLKFQNQLNKRHLCASEENYKLLREEHESLKTFLNSQNESGKLQSLFDHSPNTSEVTNLQNEVGELAAKLMSTEDERNEALQTIEQLQQDLKVLCENCDQIPILNSQIEEYKRVLNREKLSRDEVEKNYISALQEIEELNGKIKPHHGRRYK